MSGPRYDKTTGEELYPPTPGRPYWHTLPPVGGGPLRTAPRDDPYGVAPTQSPNHLTTEAID